MKERIQKVLANAGIGSRRQIESWIREGRISVNRATAQIGDHISTHDTVCIDGREIRLQRSQSSRIRVILYYKPEGEICSRSDPEGRPTVFDRLPLCRNGRWINVGRLDFNTSGLLLLTNHGELANKLMHPSAELEREYAVRIQGQITPESIKALTKGVKLEDGMARFHTLVDGGGEGSNHWYHVTVKEGRNRLVRRLFESQNLMVSRLIRIRFGSISLPRVLKRGRWLEMPKEDVLQLMREMGLKQIIK